MTLTPLQHRSASGGPILIGLALLAGLTTLALLGASSVRSQEPQPRWVAQLSGSLAVPPNASDASGVFIAYPDGDVIAYTLLVPAIERATSATLNLATESDLGEPIAFVFRPAEPVVEALSQRQYDLGGEYDVVNAIDVTSSLTPVDDCGFHCWGQLSGSLRGDLPGLIRELDAGHIFVTVQTKIFRQGELRGRVRIADLSDPDTIALIEEARGGAAQSDAASAANTADDGFPAWAWALMIAGVATALVAGSIARGFVRLPRRGP